MALTLNEKHAIYVAYLNMKVEEEDWHGVSDAANDLRELEVKMSCQTHPLVKPLTPSSSDIWEALKRRQPSVILSNDTPSPTPSPDSTTLRGL